MKGRRNYMFEKMFTTKMSMDKKKLQIRFLKIRSDNGKNTKLFSIALLSIVIAAIIAVSLIIAVNNSDNCKMTDEQFSDYINRPIGSVMASLDYVDDEKIVFHYLEGFFVVDRKNKEIVHKINLDTLNIAGDSQGDCYTEFKVDKDGKYAYLVNGGNQKQIKNFDSYVIDLVSGKVKQGNIPDIIELFPYHSEKSTVDNAQGWVGNGIIERDCKTYYLTVQDSVIGAIQMAIVHNNEANKQEFVYVFGDDHTTASQQKVDLINKTLSKGEKIIVNSGWGWEVNEDVLRSVLNKLGETKQLKHIDVKDRNYNILTYQISKNGDSYPRLYVIDNYDLELVFSSDLSKEEYFEINKLMYISQNLNHENLNPEDIKDIIDAELIIKNTVYPLVVRGNLKNVENMLSAAKLIKYQTDCPIGGVIVITKSDGEKGTVSLATDSCAVFVSNGTYYDYSDGDNSELLGYFGIDSKDIFDLIR